MKQCNSDMLKASNQTVWLLLFFFASCLTIQYSRVMRKNNRAKKPPDENIFKYFWDTWTVTCLHPLGPPRRIHPQLSMPVCELSQTTAQSTSRGTAWKHTWESKQRATCTSVHNHMASDRHVQRYATFMEVFRIGAARNPSQIHSFDGVEKINLMLRETKGRADI